MTNIELPVLFLLVEDNTNNLALIFRAIAKAKLNIMIQYVESAEKAIDYLLGIGQYDNRKRYPLPDAILLDKNSSVMDEIKLLKWLKKQPSLKDIPFLIMSHSDLIQSRETATSLGATYITKSTSVEDYISILKTFKNFKFKK
ncbi:MULTISPECIES: response regulator [Nostocales]|uniref:Response regulator n=2 Tax=Nostocales TaxID=1161 RepID=A0A8S9T3W6_9CYAN|nr:response regulator [Tolypothrix bouteillei]KAF3886667.1 response regulator [Tolypothrix bouteillei VB521301]